MKYSLLALILSVAVLLNAQTPTQQPQNKGQNASQGSSSKGTSASAGSSDQKLEKYAKVKWRKKLKIARKEIDAGSYISAAEYLEDVYKDKPDKTVVLHLLGDVNRYLRDYEQAEKYYKLSLQKSPDGFIDDSYYLGIMEKMNGKYDDARKTLSDYLKAKLDKGDHNYKNQAKIDIEGIDSAQIILKNPSKIKVEKTMGINRALTDFSPQPLKGNRIMFAQQKTDTAVDNTTIKTDYYASIFTAEKSGKAYINKTLLPYPPNEKHANTGNAILSGDEKTMIYTVCHDSLDEGNHARCKLYRITKKNALEWNEPEDLKGLNGKDSATNTTHPAWGVDDQGNNILYFASNRKGTKGGMDIFYAKMNSDGTFGEVINAGPEVNTIGDEVTPFYDMKNKVLYFSSNGHPSIGGFDIFKISGTPGKWAKTAINAGVPINSQADDMYLSLDPSGANGFEVSNRIGTTSSRGATCCDDIWSVTLVHDIVLKAIYVMRGDATNTPVEGVDASLYKVNGNNFEFVANSKTTKDPSYFPLKRGTLYKINGNKDGFWPSIDNLSVAEDEDQDTISKVFYLDPIIKIHIKIPNVYFAFDKSNIITFYKEQIDSVVKIMNDHPAYTVEIQGNTDTMGSDEYNQKLSERRANEVKEFLIKTKKIAENRIVAKWFGRTNPAVPNELPNGEDDPEGRARNRRVEFKIITDKPEDAPEIEHVGEVVKQVKTGPGFTYGRRAAKPAPKKK